KLAVINLVALSSLQHCSQNFLSQSPHLLKVHYYPPFFAAFYVYFSNLDVSSQCSYLRKLSYLERKSKPSPKQLISIVLALRNRRLEELAVGVFAAIFADADDDGHGQ